MPKAIWNGQVIAESETTIKVEGNHYFPHETIKSEFFEKSNLHSICPWKGEASYYNIVVNGDTNKDAAWYYPEVKEAAERIRNYVAFWRGVEIEE